MIPYARHNGAPMTECEVAEWLGYRDAAAMNAEHDALHARLCAWLGVPSYSLAVAAGAQLPAVQYTLAELEEHAVLATQRLIQHHRMGAE